MPDQHNRHGQRAHREKAGDADNPKENQEPQKIEKKARRKAYITNQAFRWITLTVDVLVFAAVAIYSFFAYQQWQAMNGQLVEMRKTTKAATDGLALTRDMSHLDQRAWIALHVITGQPAADQPIKIIATMRNTGKTLAKNFRAIAGIEIFDKGEPGHPEFSVEENAVGTDEEFGKPRAVVPPNGEYSAILPPSYTPKTLTSVDVERIKSGHKMIFIHGRAEYEDIFNCKHWTTYCYYLARDGSSFFANETHNEVDDNSCP